MVNVRKDTEHWESLILPALDEAGNALCPRLHTKEKLLEMQEKMPYDFASQYQQNPIPAGGAVFKKDWFVLTNNDPEMIFTFITCDTAETKNDWNDQTVFSFWGVYKLEQTGVDTPTYCLHWLECMADWIEAKDIESAFMSFYSMCLRYPVPPQVAAIEKKSTGVTLIGTLKEIRGLKILEIDRNVKSGSKVSRFKNCQPYIASKFVSLPFGEKHTQQCIDHMAKITLSDAHALDDIADTCADAIDLIYISKILLNTYVNKHDGNRIIEEMAADLQRKQQAQRGLYGR